MSVKHKNNDTPSIIRNEEKYTNDPIAIAKLSVTFSHQLLRLFSRKLGFQINPLESFYQQKKITLS